jgi:hypothetical protein
MRQSQSLGFELLDKSSQMRRQGSGDGVMLLQALTYGCEPDPPLNIRIDSGVSGTGN